MYQQLTNFIIQNKTILTFVDNVINILQRDLFTLIQNEIFKLNSMPLIGLTSVLFLRLRLRSSLCRLLLRVPLGRLSSEMQVMSEYQLE